MARQPYGIVQQQIERLLQRGSLAGLSEWQLLERYATQRDERAFEALVARHGPNGPRRLPSRAAQRSGRRGCLPGHIPRSDPQGSFA